MLKGGQTERIILQHVSLKNIADPEVLAKKMLVSEMNIAIPKWTNFGITQGKKIYLTKMFHFWSCDLEKCQNFRITHKKPINFDGK